MHRKEINARSPLRLLESSIRGGLGRGNVGVIVSRRGVGKTAFLVGVALDDLMRGHKVLHVCLDHPMDKARMFYDDVFVDLAHSQALEDPWRVRVELERNRRIYQFDNAAFDVEKLRQALQFLRDHGDFQPSVIIVDGWDFERVRRENIDALRDIARMVEAELWLSAVTDRDRERNARGVPEPVASLEGSVDVILGLAHDGRAVHVSLLKDHDNPRVSELKLALDPTSMLLVEE